MWWTPFSLQFVNGLPADEMQSLLFLKVLGKKPGWKDSNFQVMKAKFAIVATLAERAAVFGKKSTASVLPSLVEKLADIKVESTDWLELSRPFQRAQFVCR